MNGVKKCYFGGIPELHRVILLQEVDEVSTKLYMVLGSVALHVVGKSVVVLAGIIDLLNVKGI